MDSAELLQLMETSIVKTGLLQNTKVYGRPEWLAFSEDSFFKGTYKGKPCKVLNLKQSPQAGVDIKSYICDYRRNEINYQVLSGEADYCFTITMNGCTFGIGSPTRDGSVLVSHGNMAEAVGQGHPEGDQAQRQLTIGQGFHGNNSTFVTPEMYRDNKANATTFGIRGKGGWNFYYQRYRVAGGGVMELLDLTEVKLNAVQS